MIGDNSSDTLEWTVRLWVHEPKKLGVILMVAILAACLGWVLLQAPIGVVLGFLFVGGATGDFWLPVHFKLNAENVSRRCGLSVTSMAWSEVKRAEATDLGIKLSPLALENSRMEPFRGVFLRFEGNAEAVREAIARYWGQDVRSLAN